MKETEDKIVAWIKEKIREAGAKGAVVGLSGGVDSSTVATLCKKAFPDNIQGVIMPCFSNPSDLLHAKMIAEKFDIPYYVVELAEPFKKIYQEIEGKEYNEVERSMAISNLKPRLRMVTLYYFANKNNYLVVGTDNKTESMVGYFTKYGDGGVDILPISDLFKRDVRKLAVYLGVPKEIIEKKPSAGLWEGQTDEGEIGMSYDELDEILHRIENKMDLTDFDSKKIEKVRGMLKSSEHKRNLPPVCKLS